MRDYKTIIGDALLGGIAGAIATWAMAPAYSRLHGLERDSAKEREKEISPELPSTQLLAQKLGRGLGIELSDEQRKRAGQAIHWSFGIGWGALFGVLQSRLGLPRWARGLAFGTTVGVIGQAVLLPAFKLSPPPTRYPIDTSLVGWGAHLVYGTAAQGALGVLRRAVR